MKKMVVAAGLLLVVGQSGSVFARSLEDVLKEKGVIAVGNKSMAMHMVSGADLCIECFARNHYNQGTLGVIHRRDKV